MDSVFKKFTTKIVKKLIFEEKDKIGILSISSQECSRKCLEWDLIEIKEKIDFPAEISYFYENYKFLCLCGGAVLDFLNKKKAVDYDFFMLSQDLEIVSNFLQKIRETCSYSETENAITILIKKGTIGFCKEDNKEILVEKRFYDSDFLRIQFIKRTYERLDLIIGGFDIDICKFAYYNNKIFCTPTAFLSMKKKINFVNLYNQSKTFIKRCYKYSMKGYKVYNVFCLFKSLTHSYKDFSKEYDYSQTIATNNYIDYKEFLLRSNLSFLLKKRYHRLTISNFKFEKKDFIDLIERLYISEKKNNIRVSSGYNGNPYMPVITGFVPFTCFNNQKSRIEKVYKKKNKIYTNIICIHQTCEDLKNLRLAVLEKRFHFYSSLPKIKITNTSSQFTGSFYPTTYPIEKLCMKYEKIDFLKAFPQFLFILKNNKLPKYLRYKVCKYYINNLIMDY